MVHKNRTSLLILGLLVAFLLALSCARQPLPAACCLPGFWKGLLHGFIAPATFIISLFTDIRIYEFPNGGRWYDFGFMLGIGGFGGGIFGSSRRKK